jgi:methylated-DNA-[protein]-cysteine S-methyltransferase
MKEKLHIAYVNSPVGILKIITDSDSVLEVRFMDSSGQSTIEPPEIMLRCIRQLAEYFNGTRKEFDLELKPAGTEFQIKTWNNVIKVPYGKTTSYLGIAKQTGSEKNTRAVGTANGKNPIPIIIPCHRIIGTNGKLTGYSGGMERKRWLLRHESTHSAYPEKLF